jgi:hypothetical protein
VTELRNRLVHHIPDVCLVCHICRYRNNRPTLQGSQVFRHIFESRFSSGAKYDIRPSFNVCMRYCFT